MDTLRADLEPGAGCCFASTTGSDLTLTAQWGGEGGDNGSKQTTYYQLKTPAGGGLPEWFPTGSGAKHGGLKEIRLGGPIMPQWLLLTELSPAPPPAADALAMLPRDIPEALRLAGCSAQAILWEFEPPARCETGPCTVFGIPDGAAVAATTTSSVGALAVPDSALFFDNGGLHLKGTEATSDGGAIHYASRGDGLLRVLVSSPTNATLLEAELRGHSRLPIRTRERQRIVYLLHCF